MRKCLLDSDVADEAPTSSVLTGYDEERLLTYIRLLDAAAEEADWREVARIVLHIDPEKEPERRIQGLGDASRPRPVDDDERLPISAGGRCAALKTWPDRLAKDTSEKAGPVTFGDDRDWQSLVAPAGSLDDFIPK